MSKLANIPGSWNLPMPLKKIKDKGLFTLDGIYYPEFKKHSEKMKKYQNLHPGGRCFIIGTGPSLKETNFKLLKDEILFGVNTLYKGMKEFNINCKYYAVSDLKVWEPNYKPILGLDTVLFLSSFVAKDYLKNYDDKYNGLSVCDIVALKTKGYMTVSKEFSKDPSKYVVGGHSVIPDICLQVAYYMGFNEVYLLGTDYSNVGTRWDGSKTENTIAKGLSDIQRVFYAFDICKRAYDEDGRKIINLSPGSKLEIFEKKKLEDIIK